MGSLCKIKDIIYQFKLFYFIFLINFHSAFYTSPWCCVYDNYNSNLKVENDNINKNNYTIKKNCKNNEKNDIIYTLPIANNNIKNKDKELLKDDEFEINNVHNNDYNNISSTNNTSKTFNENIKSVNDNLNLIKDKDFILIYKKRKDGDYDIIYCKNKLYSDHVYKNVLWWQSTIIKSTKLKEFIECLKLHLNKCHKNSDSRVSICAIFKYCRNDCKMQEFEDYFLNKHKINADYARGIFENNFFNKGRHKRKNNFIDFFNVIANNFYKISKNGKQKEIIYSENNNTEYTYLYLLTKEYMYELGFNIKKEILFLMHINLINNYKHFHIYDKYSSFLSNIINDEKLFTENTIENNFESLFDIIWQYDLKNDKTTINDKNMNNFEKIFSEDILKFYKNNVEIFTELNDIYKSVKLY